MVHSIRFGHSRSPPFPRRLSPKITMKTPTEIARECAEKIHQFYSRTAKHDAFDIDYTTPAILAALALTPAKCADRIKELEAASNAWGKAEQEAKQENAKMHFELIAKDAEIARLERIGLRAWKKEKELRADSARLDILDSHISTDETSEVYGLERNKCHSLRDVADYLMEIVTKEKIP